MTLRTRKISSLISTFLAAASILILLVVQFVSLFHVPVLDSWGDESWLMLEFRQQICTGIMYHPFAYGATIHVSNGVVFGSSWITAGLYGLCAIVFAHTDIVVIGRIVTITIALATFLMFGYFAQKRYHASGALLVLSVVMSSRLFLLVSHSARYDVITALGVFFVFLLVIHTEWVNRREAIKTGFAFGSAFLITSHAVLILIPLGIYSLIRCWRLHGVRGTLWFALASVGVPLVCIGIYLLLSPSLSLFGAGHASGFQTNLQQIPLTHILSGSALLSAMRNKLNVAWNFAPLFLILMVASFVLDLVGISRKTPFGFRPQVRLACWLVVLGYLLFEGAQFYYLFYIVPVSAWLVLDTLEMILRDRYHSLVVQAAAIAIAFFGIQHGVAAERTASSIATENRHADSAFHRFLDSITAGKPTGVLLANQTVHDAMQWSSVVPMTTHFQDFPISAEPWSKLLRTQHVRYAEVIASGPTWWYSPQVVTLRAFLAQQGHLIFKQPGYLLEAGRDYFHPVTPPKDTLLLYELGPPDSATK